MASTDARPIPIKNTAYRVTFPILDADGDLVTGATGLDSEVSIDGGTFADCTNEATEIATSSGVYYLDLTSGEMNGDTVALIIKTSSSGAKTTVLVLYPNETGDIDVDVTAFGGSAGTFASGRPEVNTSHIAGSAVSTSSAQIGVNVVQVSGDATAADNAEAFFDGTGYAGTNNVIPTVTTVTNLTNAPTNGDLTATMKASVNTEVDTALSDYGALRPTTAGRTLDVTATGEAGIDWANVGSPTTTVNFSGTTIKTATDVETDTADIQSRLPAALVSGRMDSNVQAMANNVITSSVISTDAIGAAQIAADAIGSSELATTAVSEITAAIEALVLETGLTWKNALRLIASSAAGKASGLATATAVYRNAVADDKDRITATVDADGNRTAITYDLT